MKAKKQNGPKCFFGNCQPPLAFVFAVFLMLALPCTSLFAQAHPPGDTTNEENPGEAEKDTSKRTDESEESYRTRMELRDQRYRDQPRADMIYSTPGGQSKLDQLPEASREHIKEQLRDMIVDSRQWKPGEDVSDYPYEPSEAAQSDPNLRNQEREAWVEQLQKYQQREAAAYATANGQQDGQAGEQGAEKGTGDEGKSGSKGSPGAKSEAAGKSQPGAANNQEEYQQRQRDDEAASTAGVSESALSFVQGNGGQMENAGSQGEEKAASQSDAAAEGEKSGPGAEEPAPKAAVPGDKAAPGSVSLEELALLQGMGKPSEDNPADASAPQASTATDPGANDKPAEGQEAENPPDTLAINDLQKIDTAALRDSGPATPEMTNAAANPVATPAVEPGTLEISELKRLEDH